MCSEAPRLMESSGSWAVPGSISGRVQKIEWSLQMLIVENLI